MLLFIHPAKSVFDSPKHLELKSPWFLINNNSAGREHCMVAIVEILFSLLLRGNKLTFTDLVFYIFHNLPSVLFLYFHETCSYFIIMMTH